MSGNATYTEKDIKSLERLEYIRKRPTALVGDTEAGGLTQIAKEIIDNSIDELAHILSSMGLVGGLWVTLCRDTARGTFQMIIRDTGRGVPIGSLVDSFTKPMTSGKFDQGAYVASSGLFGQGSKSTAGLSSYFRPLAYHPHGVGSLLVQSGVHPLEPTITDPIPGMKGTTIVYEPDPTIFSGIPEYAESGYVALLNLLKKYVFFNNYPIEFRLSEQPVPLRFWTEDNATATQTLLAIENQAPIIWSSALHDRMEWIRHYWHITRPFAWQWAFHKTTPPAENLQSFAAHLFYVKFEQKGDAFGMVNNVPIDAVTSNHLSIVYEQLTHALAQRINDKDVRKFFVESYRLPIFVAVDVKFAGAEFSGTMKNAFVSGPFREVYREELSHILSRGDAQKMLNELFELLAEDITSRYMQSLSGMGKAKVNLNRIGLELNRRKFQDCSTKNRAIAELFLVEGESAGGAIGCDEVTQATYQLSGKPKNVMTDARTRQEMMREFLANEIYQDICRIINFDPIKPNLDNLNFGRCFFMADGDPHGRHIAALLLGAFQVAAPMLVQSGFFGIVAPPYYEVWAGRRKTASTYVRDHNDLIQWKTLNVYSPQIDIDVEWVSTQGSATTRLDRDKLLIFMIKIAEIGIALENLANEFSLPGLLVEALTRVTYYLTPATMNTEIVKHHLGAHKVEYNPHIHTLIVSIGRDDYVIPLFNVADRLCEQVSIILQRLQWRNWNIYVTSKRNRAQANVPMTIYQLYEFMKIMDRMITVKPLKGIGSMASEDAARTCMDVRNRRVYNITEAGDVDRIFELLGDDPQARKDLRDAPPLTDYRHVRL